MEAKDTKKRKAKDVADADPPRVSKRLNEVNAADNDEEDKEESKDFTFKIDGTIMFGDFGTKASVKIAGFDMDSTLINTKSGRTFAINASDWVWWNDAVPTKLKAAHDDGFKIVIFSNQAGVSSGQTTSATLKSKFMQLHKSLKIPFQFLCATASDEYRKPSTGMWRYFVEHCNADVKVNIKQSLYCGDAAGRPKSGKRAKDFSDSDRKFAINCGLTFYTPEMYFLGEKEKLPPLAFDIKRLQKLEGTTPADEETKTFTSDKQEMVLFVGGPGAGKSTFWSNYLSDYVRVNNDTLKTKEKCMKVARAALDEGKSVVIDNTNPDADTRKRYTSIAAEKGVPIRCFFFDFAKDICMHNNKQRKTNEHRQHLSKKVGDVIIHTFYKKLEKPTTAEGFSEVKTIKFVPGPFHNDKDKEVYYNS